MNQYYNYDRPPRSNAWKTVLIIVLVVLILGVFIAGGIGLYKILKKNFTPIPEQKSSRIEESVPSDDDNKGTVPEKSEPKSESSETEPSETIPDDKKDVNPRTDTDDTPSKYEEFINLSASSVAEKALPSVVCIQNYRQVQQPQYPYQYGGSSQQTNLQPVLAGEGSGVVYTSDGYIITNNHVIKDATLIKVILNNEETYEATLIGADPDTDLALIKISATDLTPIELGDYSKLKVGDFVMAIGNPGGSQFSSSVSLGIVSAKDRPLQIDDGYLMNTIQTDAAINPGNSGGALVNMKGQLVGINSAKYVASGYEGLGFSITIEEALPIIEDLRNYGKVTGRALLGITGIYVDDLVALRYGYAKGYYVYETINPNVGSLEPGDIITKINNIEVSSDTTIKNALAKRKAGEVITVEYWREGNLATTQITLISADS